MERIELCSRLSRLLSENGFMVESFLESNSCFDLIAKKNEKAFVLKVYSNIDSIRAEQANELKKISDLFNAMPLIIGEKTKAFELKGKTIYERFGIGVITLNSFNELLQGVNPEVKSFKGREIVALDYGKLKNKRIEMDLSCRELAKKIDLDAETIYRYEKGENASMNSAKKLEEALKVPLIKKIDLNESMNEMNAQKEKFGKELNEEKENELTDKFKKMGLNLELFSHSPIEAMETKTPIMLQKGKTKKEMIRKAITLEKTGSMIESDSMILTKEFPKKSIHSIPVVEEEELESLSKKKDLIELLHERKKK